MAIDGVKNVQAAGYQVSQAKPIETVNFEAADSAVETQTVNTSPVKEQPAKKSAEESGTEGNADGQLREVSNEQIKKAVSDMNKKMENTSCQFGIHEGTGRVTIKIVDKQSKEVLKEFPAEETLEMLEKAWELAGIMVDEKL